MNTTKYCSIALFSMVTASAFAQMTSSDQMMAPAPMPPSSTQAAPMAPMAPMNDGRMNDGGMNSSGASGMDSGRSGYDASGMSGARRTTGDSMATGSRMGDRYGYGVNGSQTNANDVHATPQPGSINNQIYRGN